MKWETVKLGDITDVRDGTHDSPKYHDEGYPLVTSKNIKNGRLDLSEVNLISESDFININKRSKVDQGDILMPMIGTIGNPVLIDMKPFFAIKNVCLIKQSKEVNNKYIYYLLKSSLFEETLLNKSRGGTQKFLSLSDIRNFIIPLPPLHIQEQIADALDKADALRRKDQELLTKYDELAQAIFYNMFGDPVKNDKGWVLVKLNRLIGELSAGVSVNSTDEESDINKPCVLKTSCVYTGKFNPKQSKVIIAKEINKAKITPKKDSIIISRMNTNELVGRSAYVSIDYNNLYLPDRLWMTKKGELKHSVKWLSFALKTRMFMDQVGKIATGTSGSMKNIGKKEFLNLQIIYPDIISQTRFEQVLSSLDQSILQLEETRDVSDKLFKKILFDYFS